jgi:hypothetical protein
MDIRTKYLMLCLALWYVFTCIVVAKTAHNRGHNFADAFSLCLFASPLIGAILYSRPKRP